MFIALPHISAAATDCVCVPSCFIHIVIYIYYVFFTISFFTLFYYIFCILRFAYIRMIDFSERKSIFTRKRKVAFLLSNIHPSDLKRLSASSLTLLSLLLLLILSLSLLLLRWLVVYERLASL